VITLNCQQYNNSYIVVLEVYIVSSSSRSCLPDWRSNYWCITRYVLYDILCVNRISQLCKAKSREKLNNCGISPEFYERFIRTS